MTFGVPVVFFVVLAMVSLEVNGHGRLLKPPSRASMWRFGYSTPPNYDDNQLFCGGFWRQWGVNKGKCGVCGDPYDGPREHEAGGKFATGTIVAHHSKGQIIDVDLQITASHRGYFEFRMCPLDKPKTRVTQECLDKYVLRQPNGNSKVYEKGFPTNYTVQLVLPKDITCSQCVLQWKYNTGNSYGCDGSHCCIGCGQQEQFYGCSDISIGTSGSVSQHFPETNHIQSPNQTPDHDSKQIDTAVSSSGNVNNQHAQPIDNIQKWNQYNNQYGQQTNSASSVSGSVYIPVPPHVDNTQILNEEKHTQQNSLLHILSQPTAVKTESEAKTDCRATTQYKAMNPYADQFCVVQCVKGYCPSKEFCTDECRRL